MKVDFTKLVVSDINGTVIPETYKLIAQSIYSNTKDLNLVDVAIKINKGEVVDIAQTELDTIKQICNDEKIGFFAFVKKAINDFIDGIKK